MNIDQILIAVRRMNYAFHRNRRKVARSEMTERRMYELEEIAEARLRVMLEEGKRTRQILQVFGEEAAQDHANRVRQSHGLPPLAPACCEGGPQWGHSHGCKEIP